MVVPEVGCVLPAARLAWAGNMVLVLPICSVRCDKLRLLNRWKKEATDLGVFRLGELWSMADGVPTSDQGLRADREGSVGDEKYAHCVFPIPPICDC